MNTSIHKLAFPLLSLLITSTSFCTCTFFTPALAQACSPTLLGRTTGTFNNDVFASGNYAYIAEANGLAILDVSNPGNSTLTKQYETPGYTTGVYVLGDTAYVADWGICPIHYIFSPKFANNIPWFFGILIYKKHLTFTERVAPKGILRFRSEWQGKASCNGKFFLKKSLTNKEFIWYKAGLINFQSDDLQQFKTNPARNMFS